MEQKTNTPPSFGQPSTNPAKQNPGGLLSGVELFAGLEPGSLAEIERACRTKRFQPQEQVIDCDSSNTDVFVIVDGKVRVLNYSVNGREIAFDDVGPGGYFGEIAALDGPPRSATVIAVDETLVLMVPAKVFMDILSHHPKVAFRVMQRLARIVRSADTRIMDLSTLAAQNRVQAEILRQARSTRRSDDTATIEPIPLHSDIASRVSTTRETVARVMNDLARQGLVSRTKTALIIKDISQLEALVEEVRGQL